MADLPFDPTKVPIINWDDPSPAQIVNLSQRVQILEFLYEQLAQQVADLTPPVGG